MWKYLKNSKSSSLRLFLFLFLYFNQTVPVVDEAENKTMANKFDVGADLNRWLMERI